MLGWMLYAVTVSLLLALAAEASSHGARLRGKPSRWCWVFSMAGSLLIPAGISSVSIELPRLVPMSGPAASTTLALRDLAPKVLAPSGWLAALPHSQRPTSSLDRILLCIWLAASATFAVLLLVSAAGLAWRKRRWAHGRLAGMKIRIADDAGPALAGLLRPEIVVPRWLLQADAETQTHVMAHETAHLAAGDSRLLAAGIGLLVLMPWNLPLWWQVRRLRLAIETDCDARVIRAGCGAVRYAETLIGIGERRGRGIGVAMAMAEPVTHLERRIRIMLQTSNRRGLLTHVPALAALALAIVAAAVSPPNADATGAPSALDRYAGFYQMGPSAVLTVTQRDGQLLVRLTGQPALRVTPTGPSRFSADAVGAVFDFTASDDKPATAVTLHQRGQVIALARIDADRAQRIEAATTDRVQRDAPLPGSRAALSKLADGVISGAPDYAAMSPALARVIRQQLSALHQEIGSLGPVQSMQFVRVGSQGEDEYLVKQQHGMTRWRIVLQGNIIAGAWVSPAS